ncbi:MAG: DNA-3-methyladenine glycosylase [Alcaligenaceae bacterium]|nr:DNA-3-methyladenine glycosylase [Alcaligenaceae bacterium]
MASFTKLPRAFYDRNALILATDLLGKLLIHQQADSTHIGRIVEVEAYLGPQDLAAHTSKGLTARTRAMFGPPGHAYVYLVYGMHHCMNVVAGPEGSGTAVLLRALEPVSDLPCATNGPGRLCKALGITLAHYGQDLCSDDLYLADDGAATDFEIVSAPRIGVDYAGKWADKPLRFYIAGNRWVSKAPKAAKPR